MVDKFTRVILTPSAVFLSVLFGGAFGSGREVVEFMSQHGPAGGFVSMMTIATVYSVCLFLSFEIARIYKIHEYRSFYKLLIGRGWFLYELVITFAVIAILAICASSAGAVLKSHFGLSTSIGSILLLLMVVILNYGGREIVERSMRISVLALSGILITLLIIVLTTQIHVVAAAFDNQSSFPDAVRDGLKYAITNAGLIPLLLFCGSQLESRRESLVAGISAGIAGIAPACSFHLMFLADYPHVLRETLPTYFMIDKLTSPMFLDIYVLVLFVMIAQTGVGILHGAIERIDGWMQERTGAAMNKYGHAAISGAALLASMALASVGLVELIARTYKFLSIVFLLIFILPLFVAGIPRILRANSPPSRH